MPLYRPRTWTIPSSPGLHACAIPPFTCLMQALYMDTSALYGPLCMNNSAIYGPYTGPAHGQSRPLRASMHRQSLHLRALYTPCTWTLPPSTGLYMHGQFRHLRALYRPCTWTLPPSTGLYAWTIPCACGPLQAPYSDNPCLHGHLYTDNPVSMVLVQALCK